MTQSYNLSQLANNLNTAGRLDATDGLSGAVPPANGGTGLASYAVGDLIYASGSTTLAKLADVATGNVLLSGGAGVAPGYGKVPLTTHISGILPVANGGSGVSTSTGSGNVVLSNSPTLSNINFPDGSIQSTAATGFGFKNRIINGAIMIDQRNAGASVIPTSGNYTYPCDRFGIYVSQASKCEAQQTPSATETGYANRVAAGFVNYLGITSSSAYSIVTTDIFIAAQRIEGVNCSDLGWGTASAKTVTLSFLAYSSLTGTFGGSVNSIAGTYSYPFSYSIPTANTWTTITITVPGPTAGTWGGLGNSGWIQVNFGLGVGSLNSGTAGSWTAATLFSATGAVSIVGTAGAKFYVTGVQLEKGSTATTFDYRPYGTELVLCQRYLPAFLASNATGPIASGFSANSTLSSIIVPFNVTARVRPTGISISNTSHFALNTAASLTTCNAVNFSDASLNSGQITVSNSAVTAGQGCQLVFNSSSGYLLFTGCEL